MRDVAWLDRPTQPRRGEATLAEILGGLEHYMHENVFTYP
jgi:hypothetical protein